MVNPGINKLKKYNQTISQLRKKDPAERDELISRYAPLVKTIAGRLALKLPHHVSQDDLTSAGLMGLLDAIDRFDVEKGVEFKSYAEFRIKSASASAERPSASAKTWIGGGIAMPSRLSAIPMAHDQISGLRASAKTTERQLGGRAAAKCAKTQTLMRLSTGIIASMAVMSQFESSLNLIRAAWGLVG